MMLPLSSSHIMLHIESYVLTMKDQFGTGKVNLDIIK